MPIKKRWSTLTADRIRRNVPERTGIYELRAGGDTVFIGRARNLRRELLTHLADEEADGFRYELVDFLGNPERRHRRHFDNYVRRHDRLPAWMTARP